MDTDGSTDGRTNKAKTVYTPFLRSEGMEAGTTLVPIKNYQFFFSQNQEVGQKQTHLTPSPVHTQKEKNRFNHEENQTKTRY